MCGGLAGCLGWCVIYPFDLINTKIQTRNSDAKTLSVVRELYQEGGIQRFYRGLSATILRSLLTDAILLVSFDHLNELLVNA